MPETDFDCIVIGAGAAGLAALAHLDRAGCRALCLEARDRIGGRILTVHDPLCPVPVELGAEFIHGRSPELWNVIRSAALPVYDCADSSVQVRAGRIQNSEGVWEQVDRVMTDMQESASEGTDEPFSVFLARSPYTDQAKQLASSFVEGFNAARQEMIGIASLAVDAQASDAIDGDKSFRFVRGYDSVPSRLFDAISDGASKLRFNTQVTHIEWRPGFVTVRSCSALTGEVQTFTATKLVVTVPLGVLTAEPDVPGSICWNPAPQEAFEAARKLAFGQVVRLVLRFKEPFWEEQQEFADAGFLLSDEHLFPTWWSSLAVRAPVLTGWSAGPHADALLGQPRTVLVNEAASSLAKIFGIAPARIRALIEGAYFHDWHADPFTRGAYSYVPAGALPAREKLAEPVADTLFFAGEATELNGHSATVHGAIASGKLAAAQVLRNQS